MNFQEFSDFYVKFFHLNAMDEYIEAKYVERFYRLTEQMLSVNEHMNLTAITEPSAIVLKHYVDSLTVSPYLPAGAHVVDIGCGAGFPTLPLAIVRPDLHILALDSTAKRIEYVKQTANMLALSNVETMSCRAEAAAAVDMPLRESFDCVISRAVANLQVLSELCVPYIRVGGRFVAMKGDHAGDEVTLAKAGIARLGGKIDRICTLALYGGEEDEERNLVVVEKIGKTPKNYPRNYAQIKKKPL